MCNSCHSNYDLWSGGCCVWLAYLDLCKLLCIILLSWSLICLYTLIFSSRIDKRHFECTEIGSSTLKRMSWFVSFVLFQSYITSSCLSFVIGSLFSGLLEIFFHAGYPAQERWSSGRATIGQAGWCSHKLIWWASSHHPKPCICYVAYMIWTKFYSWFA